MQEGSDRMDKIKDFNNRTKILEAGIPFGLTALDLDRIWPKGTDFGLIFVREKDSATEEYQIKVREQELCEIYHCKKEDVIESDNSDLRSFLNHDLESIIMYVVSDLTDLDMERRSLTLMEPEGVVVEAYRWPSVTNDDDSADDVPEGDSRKNDGTKDDRVDDKVEGPVHEFIISEPDLLLLSMEFGRILRRTTSIESDIIRDITKIPQLFGFMIIRASSSKGFEAELRVVRNPDNSLSESIITSSGDDYPGSDLTEVFEDLVDDNSCFSEAYFVMPSDASGYGGLLNSTDYLSLGNQIAVPDGYGFYTPNLDHGD